MSIVADHVRRLDVQLDRLPLVPQEIQTLEDEAAHGAVDALSTPRVSELLRIVKSLSTTASSQALLPSWRIRQLLLQSGLATLEALREGPPPATEYESEIEWLLVSKAAIQAHGLVMRTLLDQMIPLADDIWYWDEVLGSYTYSSLYTVQTSPLRFWDWSKDIYRDSNRRLRRLYESSRELGEGAHEEEEEEEEGKGEAKEEGGLFTPHAAQRSMTERWNEFYGIVRESIAERSVANFQRRVMSPVALCRSEARRKQAVLKGLRQMTASGLGVLADEGFCFGDDQDSESEVVEKDGQEWKGVVERSVALMDMVLKETLSLDHTIGEFEDKVFAGVEEDPELSIHIEESEAMDRPAILARRLIHILETQLPNHLAETQAKVRENGRPSRLVRYWLPAGALLLSSTTLLRILVNRKDEIVNWIADLGATARDFWFNWVVDPVRKVVGTIRHDANSEIAIMSRDSLKADRESLERMVVEFARDKPSAAIGAASISESQLAEIQAKVREGDVTPVLKAYEQDLRRPFVGAVKGDLVRSLLIQVQKTKVDLEVALDGIDALLKSQELVFGFVGLTPGFLVSIGLWQYLRNVMGGRKGLSRSRRAGRSVRVLRNIDRIFSEATPSQNNLLSYKDHGLLICEVHVLRQLVHGLLPGDIEKEFLEDVDDMANIKGIQIQVRALERIRWAYSKWLR